MLRTSRLVATAVHVPATAASGIYFAKAIREDLGETPFSRAFLIEARRHGTFGPLRKGQSLILAPGAQG